MESVVAYGIADHTENLGQFKSCVAVKLCIGIKNKEFQNFQTPLGDTFRTQSNPAGRACGYQSWRANMEWYGFHLQSSNVPPVASKISPAKLMAIKDMLRNPQRINVQAESK